jgi:diguanylate cyclase (GGDEF)-like protein/PAS domain S-box-containing protein
MLDDDSNFSTTIRWATAAIAVAIAVLLPTGYFSIQYSAEAAAVRTEAEIRAAAVVQLVTSMPEMWKFQEHRLGELLRRHADDRLSESARILAPDGEEIAAAGERLGFPVLSRSVELFDSGTPVGRVKVERSLYGLLLGTGGVALLGALLGVAVFVLLRVLPRRAQHLNDLLFAEKERAEVTLHSIGDAVITTDTDEAIVYLNPVAETLTGWTFAEARGQPVARVLRLIDEETLEPVASPLAYAITESSTHSFARQTALQRRDGSRISIEDSAAPIRDRSGKVIGGVIVFHDVSEARSMAQRLTWQATHDALTGLVNRHEFESRVDQAIASARNSGKHHVVCCMDLDQFKVINDTCGHAAGDELLKLIAALIESRVRESDTLARLGGDEFGLLLDGCSLERARLIAADVLTAVRDFRFNWDGKVFSVGVSIGLAAFGPDSGSRAEILSAADSTLFVAKEQGRNRVCVYHSADVEQSNRRLEMDWVSRINHAIEEDRFTLYFQSYRPLKAGADVATHIEVLLRMIDEEGALILPGSFLPAAERYNIMPTIDRWVIDTVFSRYGEIASQFGDGPITCAINISGSSINAEGFLDFIREKATHGLPHGAICFEITETAAINNLLKTATFMKEVKALGFLFALDDFGTGSSSFGYLKNLPVDYLKIDGGFVKDLVDDPLDRAMTESINHIGHVLGLKTVAEFAENDPIISELTTMGVDFAQGYGVSLPRPLFAGGIKAREDQVTPLGPVPQH